MNRSTRDLPTGTVTFLFTDIEGSTRLLADLGPREYSDALAEHRRLLREAFMRHGGVEIDTQGDAFFIAFADAAETLKAAAEAQTALAGGPIRVRMGLHTGQPHVSNEGYVGHDVHLGARIAAAGHGGQVLLSKATADAVADEAEMTDLGEHRLKDFAEPVWIYQLGSERFPPLKTISNTNLPRPASSFVGREREVADISALLKDGARLLTLTGPGGTGKTRLSIEAATELVPEFKSGVFWTPLASLRDPTLVTETISKTLGAKNGLVEHIGEREMLLLVDNLEQVIEAAPALAELVESCPNLRLLITSRELLRVRGEVEYAVPPLSESDAVRLFSERAGIAADATMEDLCRRLENLPLAVELAAARASVLSPQQILDRLSGRLDVLKGGRDADPRQQTLRATIEWSHDLLADPEKALFARLAIFVGGCTLEAAEKVVDADLDTLQALVDKSLVRHSGDRFWMLETIGEYAVERLNASGDRDALRARHAGYFLTVADDAEGKLFGPEADPLLDMLERDHRNLGAALDHFESVGDFQSAMRLAGAIADFWDQRSHHREALGRYIALLSADDTPTVARGKTLDGAANMALMTGDLATARRWEEEAIDIHRRLGSKRGLALALWGLGYISIEEGEYESARTLLSECIELLRELGDDVGLMWITRTLAHSYTSLGDHEHAKPLYEESLQRAREAGDRALEAHALGALASIALAFERPHEAAVLSRQSLEAISQARDRSRFLDCLCSSANVLARLGLPRVATQLLSEAHREYQEGAAKEPWVDKLNSETLEAVHKVIDEAAFTDAWGRGRDLGPEAALALATTTLDDVVERGGSDHG